MQGHKYFELISVGRMRIPILWKQKLVDEVMIDEIGQIIIILTV